jgi:hypothetical protein
MCSEWAMDLYQTCSVGEYLKDRSCHKTHYTKRICRCTLSEHYLQITGVRISCDNIWLHQRLVYTEYCSDIFGRVCCDPVQIHKSVVKTVFEKYGIKYWKTLWLSVWKKYVPAYRFGCHRDSSTFFFSEVILEYVQERNTLSLWNWRWLSTETEAVTVV